MNTEDTNELEIVLQTIKDLTNSVSFLKAAESDTVLSPIAKSDILLAVSNAMKETQAYLESTVLAKGWLPAGTSQNSLPDSAFLWLSNDYKSGKSINKAAGRKFPVKGPDGTVDPKGWMAAWGILHGGMGGGSFSGGPSHDEVMNKLMSCKPAGINLNDGHASVEKSDNLPPKSDLTEDYVGAVISKAYVPITKADIELGIIFGKASVADVFDKQGDRISSRELEKAAYNFMANEQRRATRTHKETIPGVFVASWVENGVWSIGFKPDDINIAKAAQKGKFVGFSIGGMGDRIPVIA